jgi:Flp pilus assembly protein TadG
VFKSILQRYLKSTEGLSAIEFAMIAPLLITLLFGSIQVCDALICRQKVATIASSASDLVAQDSTITTAQIGDVFSAANAIVYPYPSAGSQIIISSIKNDPNHAGQYIVDWSVAQNTTAHAKGASMTVPTGLIAAGGSVIFSEVTYNFIPPTQIFHAGDITMTDHFYSHPRKSALVTCSDC